MGQWRRLLVGPDAVHRHSGLGLAHARRNPQGALAALDAADIRGRGGANFPVARKWRSALSMPGPHVVVANAGEHEPGSRKDVELLARRPRLVLEGLAVAGSVLGARKTFVAVNGGHPGLVDQLRAEIEGSSAYWTDVPAPEVVPVPNSYLAGEETALLEVLESRLPRPRFRPPLPTARGWMGYSTVVQNVETLANCAWTLQELEAGAPGTGPDTFLWTVWNSEGLQIVGESRLGDSLQSVLVAATDMRTVKAVTMGGYSGGAVSTGELDMSLTPGELADRGLSLGCASFRVITENECVGAVVEDVIAFFADASCGQCYICKRGLTDAQEIFVGSGAGGPAEAVELLLEIRGRGVCKLPDGASTTVGALWNRFPGEIKAHAGGSCDCPRASPPSCAARPM
jgi:NADH:ubiquinone oxidoreductase subunit F (NADH-binding)